MKIIVLGGAGDMGSRAVEDLAQTDGVSQVTIADRNVEGAERIVRKLAGKGAPVDAKPVDADDHASLVAALRGYDVAASSLGPFHRFEVKLVRAALDAGVDYVSICDEWEPAEEVFKTFSEEARRKNRVIVTGLGASPGMSNVGVRFLSRDLSRTRRADISVYQPLDAGGGEAVLRHMLHIMTGNVAVHRAGKTQFVPACSSTQIVEFPRFGSIRLWNMGHAEPVTIPRFMPEIEEVNFFMGYGKGALLFVKPAQWGVFKNRGVTDLFVKFLLWLAGRSAGQEPGWGAVRVDVWGQKDGQEVHRMLCGVGQMREATGLCLSVGALMVGRKELTIREGGVYAPEGCLDPVIGVQRLRAKGVTAYEDLAMTKPLG